MPEAIELETAFLGGLGRRVREARALRGLTRKILSQSSGLSERYIAQLESGQGNVSIILLRRICVALGMRLEDLVADEERHAEWRLFRDLLDRADPDRIAQAKALLDAEPARDAFAGPRVALVGLRGAGKSTLGRRAAERLGWTFVELNDEIERESALSVREIYAIYGQEQYRRLEQKALRGVLDRPGPMILATGGSIVAEPLTYDLLLHAFLTVWLRARPEDHLARVREQTALPANDAEGEALAELRAVLLTREPLYARAALAVETSGMPAERAATQLTRAIESRFGSNANRAAIRRRSA